MRFGAPTKQLESHCTHLAEGMNHFTTYLPQGQLSTYKEDIDMPTEYQAEREEIIDAAMRLLDGEKLYYLLGTARCMLELEAEQASQLQ